MCRSRRELSNAYFLAKIGLDTDENEPCQVCPTEPFPRAPPREVPPVHAVRGVSWAAGRGSVFGLLGVNGAGKTTTFEMLSGILAPSAGAVHLRNGLKKWIEE